MSHTHTVVRPTRFAAPSLIIAAAIASCAGTALAVPVVYNTGGLPGGGNVYGGIVSGDGSTVTGSGNFAGPAYRPFRWVFPAGPMQLVPMTVASEGLGISFNGQHIVGSTLPASSPTPFRWTVSGGFTPLYLLSGGPTGIARSISASGNASAGVSSSANGPRAVWWNNIGVPLSLGTLPGGNASSAYGISPNGVYVVGDARIDTTSNINHAFRYNTPFGPMRSLGTLFGGTFSKAVAVSDNGVAAGWGNKAPNTLLAFRYKFAWNYMEEFPNIIPGDSSAFMQATAINGNGTIIVGQSSDSTFGDRAFIWIGSTGTLDLTDYIASLGGNVTGWTFSSANGISSDGRSISGIGYFDGQARAFLIKDLPCLPPTAEWYRNAATPVDICADPAWPTGSGPSLPGATASLTIESEGNGPLTHTWFVRVGAPNGTPPTPLTGRIFSDFQSGLTFSVQG